RKIRDGGRRVDREEDAKKKKKQSQRDNVHISVTFELLLQHDPRLAKAMIPIPTLHITLLVTHLATQEEVDLAASVLAQVEPSLVELLGGRDLVLPFSGISHFRKEVVFVGLAPGQHRHTLDTVAELLQSHFEEQGLLQRGTRGFEPHLTIMKLSRASNLRSQVLVRSLHQFFGDQTVERLDLCSMLKKKQPDGYYYTETSLQLVIVKPWSLVSKLQMASFPITALELKPDSQCIIKTDRCLEQTALHKTVVHLRVYFRFIAS
uniref:A-kinase anchor protein 7-like phosphoesterase domain-containing protein n=1 Tax=Takifugu rubripes TaxID=31033 RepID=H2UJZ8_TAKRU